MRRNLLRFCRITIINIRCVFLRLLRSYNNEIIMCFMTMHLMAGICRNCGVSYNDGRAVLSALAELLVNSRLNDVRLERSDMTVFTTLQLDKFRTAEGGGP